MARLRSGAVVLLMAALAAIGLTGCVTAKKYKMAKEDTPPAAVLNYGAATPALELKLVTVIVYDGPGSWKQRALWDEYVVSLTNRSDGPLSVESAALVDLLGVEQMPGADPWKLEQLSETNWRKYGRVGQFVLGVGAFAGVTELSVIGYGITGGVASGVFFVMPAVLLVDIATVGVLNHRNKAKVQKEFDRRRLSLPLRLASGAMVQGSFFFPMTPGPQRLILKGRAVEAPLELVLDLAPLAGLHRKTEEKK
jgi:hypothetical protein